MKRLPAWRLADPKQDLRGLKLIGDGEKELGTITDLIVNTLTDFVDGVVLDTGKAYRIRDLGRAPDGAVRLVRGR